MPATTATEWGPPLGWWSHLSWRLATITAGSIVATADSTGSTALGTLTNRISPSPQGRPAADGRSNRRSDRRLAAAAPVLLAWARSYLKKDI